jgi:hypothetical protein
MKIIDFADSVLIMPLSQAQSGSAGDGKDIPTGFLSVPCENNGLIDHLIGDHGGDSISTG